ncbi:hypothetical protein EG328_011694 [Venturia inaequalis]|uniref:Uncharacterized protein n=1 Tax=Venturia inaequalis TaxID=5025 RepID=A0A8H3ZJV3_VENIN|nr:hypothetical protein EG328_011694 [Venturia inaequalis]KAE9994526.1 hypothetical protein EG327_009204 [Venturia inaequalis]
MPPAELSNGLPLPIRIMFALFLTVFLCVLLLAGYRIYGMMKNRKNKDHQRPGDEESRRRAVDDITRGHQEGGRPRGYEEEMDISRRTVEEARFGRETAGGRGGQGQGGVGRESVEETDGEYIGEERLQFEDEFEIGGDKENPFGDGNGVGEREGQFEVGSDSGDDETYEEEDIGEQRLQFDDESEPDYERKNPFGDENRVRN